MRHLNSKPIRNNFVLNKIIQHENASLSEIILESRNGLVDKSFALYQGSQIRSDPRLLKVRKGAKIRNGG